MDEQNSGANSETVNFDDAPPFPWDDAPKAEKPAPKKEIVQSPVAKAVPQPQQDLSGQETQDPESGQQAGIMGSLKLFFAKLTKKRDLLQEIEKTEKLESSSHPVSNPLTREDYVSNPKEMIPEIQPSVPEPTPNTEIMEMNIRLGSMEKELDELKSKAETEPETKEDTETEAIKLQINETSDAVSALQDKINLVENNVKSFDESREDISESFEGVKKQIQEIMQLQANRGEILKATIEETISRHESALEKNSLLMETEFSGIKESQNEIKTEVNGLSNTIAGLMEDVAHVGQQGKTNSDAILKQEDNFNKEIQNLKIFIDEEIKKTGSQGYFAGESVQLTKIVKNSTNTKLCMEWLEFLMELVGRNNLPEILAYYEELEWINEEVRLELMRYAEGIDFYVEKPDWKLAPDDHVKSIWFIEKLAGVKVDKNQLSVIERDIKKVKGGTEIYGI